MRHTLCAAILIALAATRSAFGLDPGDFCLERLSEAPTFLKDATAAGRSPAPIPDLPILAEIDRPDTLRFADPHIGTAVSISRSPLGEDTQSLGPWDPKAQRLYIGGRDRNGWIELRQRGQGWTAGATGQVSPDLFDPRHVVEGVQTISRSPATGVLFYSGLTAPHWLTGEQAYRFYVIDGTAMRRILAAEQGRFSYAGDDPVAGLAILSTDPQDWHRPWTTRRLAWFDGSRVILPKPGAIGPLVPVAADPLGTGRLLRDARGQLYRWNGATLRPLSGIPPQDGAPLAPVFRATLGRWVIPTDRDWYQYRADASLLPLHMPSAIVRSAAWLLGPMPGLDRWITTTQALWWEQPDGADLVAHLPDGWQIATSGFVGQTAGHAFAFRVNATGGAQRQWFALTHTADHRACTRPDALSRLIDH